jgi:hypothetical protein
MGAGPPKPGNWITHPWVAKGQRTIRFALCVASLKGALMPV